MMLGLGLSKTIKLFKEEKAEKSVFRREMRVAASWRMYMIYKSRTNSESDVIFVKTDGTPMPEEFC